MGDTKRKPFDYARAIFVSLAILVILIATKGPSQSVIAENDGIYLVRKNWWGLSNRSWELRKTENGWLIKRDGKWEDFQFLNDDSDPLANDTRY